MRVRRWGGQGLIAAAAALGVASLLTPHLAAAKLRHHHFAHHYLAPPAAVEATGGVVSEIGADIPRYPASLTKLMTLDLAFQALADGRLTLDTPLPVSAHAASVEPVKLGLMPGDSLSVRQAILAMTTMSANDAATALGEYLGGGSEYRCAQMMTLRAHALGMAQTQFYNASGLPNPGQVTTARDLSILARDIVVHFPQDQPFFEALNFNFDGRIIYSNNAMLKLYPGAMGMKTGYTILARHNLITAAERNGTILIGVALHEDSWGATYSQMTALLDNGFGGHIDGGNAVMLAARQNAQPSTARQLASNQNNLAPPSIPLPAPDAQVASLFPSADAATLAPVSTPGGSAKTGGNNRVTRILVPGWTAQVGSYARMNYARLQAITVHKMRGVGIARIARLDRHGKVLWAAQLAGLSQTDAHATCQALAARGHSCVVIAPQADHLAMRDTSAG
jgi:D-alanyl-D-alanine carboxypeptidase